jgi:acetyl esterase/lipase
MTRLIAQLALCIGAALSLGAAEAQTELPLWPDGAPGSATWSRAESVTTSPSGARIIANVRDPSLTVFLPDPTIATGTAVVIAPGGALRVLAFDDEGVEVARWLNERGIAAFVLKYRTLQHDPTAPRGPLPGMPAPGEPRRELAIVNANANPAPNDAALTEVLKLAVADMQAALRLVRRRAAEWHVDPARVGAMGFSAGGGVAIGATLAAEPGASPDFLVSLYGPSLQDVHVPESAPPLFIAVGATHFNVTNGCIALFAAWKAAGKAAELHVFDGVSGGFGMGKRGLPVDRWTDRFYDWLVARKLTSPPATTPHEGAEP